MCVPIRPTSGLTGWRAPAVLAILAHLGVTAFLAAVSLSPLMDSWTLRRLLDVGGEGNIPVWFSSTSLLLLAWMGWDLARRGPAEDARGWRLVAALFTFLSLDETASLHESVGIAFSAAFGDLEALPGVFAWVPLLVPVALLVAFRLGRWLVRATRPGGLDRRLGLAALLLWGCVPVAEVLDPVLGAPRPLIVLEESLELTGIALMIGALMTLRNRFEDVAATFRRDESVPENTAEEVAA